MQFKIAFLVYSENHEINNQKYLNIFIWVDFDYTKSLMDRYRFLEEVPRIVDTLLIKTYFYFKRP